jgi:hypothetical protein
MSMAQDGISDSANVIGLQPPAGLSDQVLINDWHFTRDLKRLKELRSFLLQEAINISPEDSTTLSFGQLNLLRYGSEGRAPTQEEWSAVEAHTQTLFRLMTEPLRRRFIFGEIPSWVSILPIVLAFVALAALTGSIFVHGVRANAVPFYLIWLMSLGAIGSVAFIGMNALSVQQDITFDLTNRKLMILRITLGALFALVLSLPFGFDGFMQFIEGISTGQVPAGQGSPQNLALSSRAMLLLLPFILGFSTSLVIMILNRLVDAVQAFFGKAATSERGRPVSPALQPSLKR